MKGDMSNAEFFSWCKFGTENNKRRGDDLMELIESAQALEESDQKWEKSLS